MAWQKKRRSKGFRSPEEEEEEEGREEGKEVEELERRMSSMP